MDQTDYINDFLKILLAFGNDNKIMNIMNLMYNRQLDNCTRN